MTRLEELLEGSRLPLVVGLVLAFVGLLSWDPTPVGAMHDDGVYALLGRALSQGEGYRFVGIALEPLAPRFPPLYPGVLALLWWVAGDVDTLSKLATGLNLVLAAGAGVLFALYLRDRLGVEPVLAAVATLLAWSYSHLWAAAFVPLSEPLFLAFMVPGLALMARLEDGEGGWREVALLVLALTLLTYTRTAGVALAGGAVLGLAVRRRFAEAGAVAVGVGVLLTPWIVWTRWATATIPVEYRDYFASYSEWLTDRLVADPGGFLGELPAAFVQVTALLSDALLPGQAGPILLGFGTPLLLLALWGFLQLARRSPGAALGAGLYLAMLVVWPFRNPRLAVPFVPLLMAALVFAIVDIRARVPVRARPGVLTAAGTVAALVLILAGMRLFGEAGTRPLRIRTTQLVGALEAIEAHTDPGDVVGAPELWPAVPLYTDRIGVPSARFRPGGEGPRQGTPQEQYRTWVLTDLEWVVTEAGGRVHGDALDLVEETCPGVLFVPARWGGQALVRVPWDADCRRRLGIER